MPGLNLTRDEAGERSSVVHVDSYHIDLDFSHAGDVFDSVTVVRFTAREPGSSTFMDLVASRVRTVTLNGLALDPAAVYREGRIALDGLDAVNEVRIEAACAYSNSGQGLHRTIDAADGRTYLYTHFEVPDARRMFATFEQPDLKATFAFTVSAPAGWTVLSNSPTPAPETADSVSTWSFAPTKRISTYITAIIAGEYHIVHDTHTTADGTVIPMAVACRVSLAAHLDADNVFSITKQGFDYFIEKFGRPYPFEKYDQVFVPEYNIGAMENVGCVTVNDRHVFDSKPTDADVEARANTLVHELAHMWFGDLVTMRWWDDLWLKESFATYAAFRCLADVTDWPSWTDFISQKMWGLRQDELPSTHPIVADIRDLHDVSVNFDGITYAKGAAVLKQLVAWVGSDEFFAGSKLYFDTYAWGSTTLVELLDTLEKTSGRDLTAWSREWLQTSGPNTLTPAFTLDADGRYASFDVRQTAAPDFPTLRSHRISIGLYSLGAGGALERTSQVTLDVVGPSTSVEALVGVAQPDLVLLNDDDLTYAKIRLDDRSLATLRAHIGDFTDSLPRALCWAAAWDMVRNAELPASDFLAVTLGGIDAETAIVVIQDLMARLEAVVTKYIAPSGRDAARASVADAARTRLYAAEPGSDLQLAWALLFIRLATSDADLAAIARLLNGSAPIDGLDIDAHVRWTIVGTLASSGRLGADGIEAELARDRTTAATAYSFGALAARPTPAAKADAWAMATQQRDLTKSTLDAIGGIRQSGRAGLGFGQSDQDELLAPYVERYFAEIAGVWQSRTVEVARSFIDGFYPRWLASPQLLAQTDAYLQSAAPAPAVRRLLLEARDDVARALAAQELDAATR